MKNPMDEVFTPTRQQKNLEKTAGPDKSALLAEFKSRLVLLANQPPEPVTRLFLNKKPICTPGNITTLISKAKTGKTATVGAIVAAIIRACIDKPDPKQTFKFSAPLTTEAVIVIDTEQSLYDAHTCHQRIYARSDQTADVPFLLHYALVGHGPDKLLAGLPLLLADAKDHHKGVFMVVLDGIADYVKSVNDEAECKDVIAKIRTLAIEYDCPIICVIHSNEAQKSGDDGRGHLGKELTRKAESNLLLSKTGEVTLIKSEKQRKAPINEEDGVAFQWSNDHGRHMLTEALPAGIKGKPGRKPTYDRQKLLEYVPAKESQAQGFNVILRDIQDIPCKIDQSTLRDIMEKWIQTGEVEAVKHPTLGHVYKRGI